MSRFELFNPAESDAKIEYPSLMLRIIEQGLSDLSPWLFIDKDLAKKRIPSLRQRYSRKYFPFARRQDSDDLACFDPEKPGRVVVIHDFATEGSEFRNEYTSFTDWFRQAIDDLISFE